MVAEGMHQILIVLTGKFSSGLLYVSHLISALCGFIEEEMLSAEMSRLILKILAQEFGLRVIPSSDYQPFNNFVFD